MFLWQYYFCLMFAEFLIIGQGLSGTWLSYYLQKEKRSFLVIDNNKSVTASRVAAGIINPVTGRRIVKTWMIDELIPFVQKAYSELGNDLGISAITEKKIIDFFPTPQMRLAFMERINADKTYLQEEEGNDSLRNYFNYEFGYGIISPAFITHIENMLPAWRGQLLQDNLLIEEEFELLQLKIETGKIRYKEIVTDKIIFCDGIASISNPYFKQLPFAFNKGEILVIEAKDLPATHIYKKGLILSPLPNDNLFWVGTNYLWEYKDEFPTKEFQEQTGHLLKNWLRVPFKIIDHKAAIRPANIERRPFVGMHPVHMNVGILNGMGSKGCSLAPYFAKQLTDHLLHKKELMPEADIKRFSKILSGK